MPVDTRPTTTAQVTTVPVATMPKTTVPMETMPVDTMLKTTLPMDTMFSPSQYHSRTREHGHRPGFSRRSQKPLLRAAMSQHAKQVMYIQIQRRSSALSRSAFLLRASCMRATRMHLVLLRWLPSEHRHLVDITRHYRLICDELLPPWAARNICKSFVNISSRILRNSRIMVGTDGSWDKLYFIL